LSCGDDKKDRTREEFCRDWATAACSEEVVSLCQAEEEECRQTQEDFCRDLVPEDFSDAMGDACINAVERAYEDGDLEGEELAVVLKLGAPCDKLIVGEKTSGQSCDSNSDCDAAGGFECVRKSDSENGKCEVPEVVKPGLDCSAAQATCEEGFYCDGDNCIGAKDPGETCTIQEECGVEAFCNDDGECEELRDTGAECTQDYQCSDGVCLEYEGETSCTDRIRLARAEPLCDELM
jgi:hypothetical protein